jgi:uncharacterized membrane protein
MNMDQVLLIAVGIGIVAGLRAMTAPAAVSWAAHLGWLHLQGSHLSFMGSAIAVAIFSLGAAAEYVNDKLPKTPSRTAPPSFIIRVLVGGFCGACVYASAGHSPIAGSCLGGIGAVIGTLGGYQVRTRLVKALSVKDIFVAIPEDLIALGLGFFILSVR